MKAQKTLQFPWVPRWHLPRLPKNWWQILIAGTILVLVMAVMVKEISNPSPPPPAPLPELTASGPIVPAAIPVVPAPIATPAPPTTWPLLQVEWQEITPTPGVYLRKWIEDDGFYTGTWNSPRGSVPTMEGTAFAKKVLPQLKGIEDGVYVAAARDRTNKNIVFLSISNGGGGDALLFISLDGEKSWYEINLPPLHSPAPGVGGLRVATDGERIRLVAQDNTVQEKWWTTTIEKSPEKVLTFKGLLLLPSNLFRSRRGVINI